MVNGKNKGNSYERYISRRLSLWWTNKERDDLFWRTNSSGGRFTQRKKTNKETIHQEADICATCSESEPFSKVFCVECKCYNDINLWSMFNKTNSGLLTWWTTNYNLSLDSNKLSLLIVKQNRKPELLLTCNKTKSLLSDRYNIDPVCIFNKVLGKPCIYFLEDFFNLDSEIFKEMITKDILNAI